MAGPAYLSRSVALAACVTLLATPVAAAPQNVPMQVDASRVDPMVAYALLASSESRSALCGVAASSAAATAAAHTAAATASSTSTTTAQGQPGAGCVLPIRDAVVTPAGAVAPAVSALPLPLLLAFGAALAFVITKLTDNGGGRIDLPISPA